MMASVQWILRWTPELGKRRPKHAANLGYARGLANLIVAIIDPRLRDDEKT